jgi:hypothetical protein
MKLYALVILKILGNVVVVKYTNDGLQEKIILRLYNTRLQLEKSLMDMEQRRLPEDYKSIFL